MESWATAPHVTLVRSVRRCVRIPGALVSTMWLALRIEFAFCTRTQNPNCVNVRHINFRHLQMAPMRPRAAVRAYLRGTIGAVPNSHWATCDGTGRNRCAVGAPRSVAPRVCPASGAAERPSRPQRSRSHPPRVRRYDGAATCLPRSKRTDGDSCTCLAARPAGGRSAKPCMPPRGLKFTTWEITGAGA